MSDKPHLVVLHDHLAEIKCHVHGYHNIPAKRWNYNGDPVCPSFSPSVREYESGPGIPTGTVTRCHYSIVDGMIEYHADNSHAFAGQKVPMLPFTAAEVAEEHWVARQFAIDEEEAK